MKRAKEYPVLEENGKHKTIKEWREDERPRERLMMHGAHTLSDAELLAILIGQGTRNLSALEIGKQLLEMLHSLNELAACDLSVFRQIRGIGNAKAVTLAAAFELGKRIESEPFVQGNSIRTPEDIAARYIPQLRGLKKEIFQILMLNSSNAIFREVVISEGTLNASLVHPREVFKIAISESCASIILMHNHPSGNCTPSEQDIEITKQLVAAGKIIEINVVDHIIIAGDSYISMARKGYM